MTVAEALAEWFAGHYDRGGGIQPNAVEAAGYAATKAQRSGMSFPEAFEVGRTAFFSQAARHFEALPQTLQDPVLNALTDLEIDPEAAGKPLLGRLKGLWSARVGSYRIIYSIEGSRRSPKVIVRAIQHRSTAYREGRGRPT